MRLTRFFVLALALLMFTGCAGHRTAALHSEIDSVAIVSFTVNNYGAFGQGAINPRLIKDNMSTMLKDTEKILSQKYTVKPVSSFIHNKVYRDLTIQNSKHGLFSPVVNKTAMPIFSNNRKEIVKGILKPAQAQTLCAELGVDAVVLVYSEWMLDSGKFVPTFKALTKNCFSMYNKNGDRLPYMRKDFRGDRVIGGAFAGIRINEDTIDQWVNAYEKSVRTIFIN